VKLKQSQCHKLNRVNMALDEDIGGLEGMVDQAIRPRNSPLT
jgi:hypothetical protein